MLRPAPLNDCLSATGGKLTVWPRAALAAAGLVLVVLLVTARGLQPDPSGMGTHRQLGFGECMMIRVFGRPCPSCGMTTAWAWLVRGDVAMAAQANLGGLLLGLLAMLAAPWAIASAIRGRWFPARPHEGALIALATAVVLVTLVDWLRRYGMPDWL